VLAKLSWFCIHTSASNSQDWAGIWILKEASHIAATTSESSWINWNPKPQTNHSNQTNHHSCQTWHGVKKRDFCRSCSMPMMNWHWSFCPGSASNPTNTPSNKQISTKPESIEAKFGVFLLESAPKFWPAKILPWFRPQVAHESCIGDPVGIHVTGMYEYLHFLDFFWDKNVG